MAAVALELGERFRCGGDSKGVVVFINLWDLLALKGGRRAHAAIGMYYNFSGILISPVFPNFLFRGPTAKGMQSL
jgi:hypothetical protein